MGDWQDQKQSSAMPLTDHDPRGDALAAGGQRGLSRGQGGGMGMDTLL